MFGDAGQMVVVYDDPSKQQSLSLDETSSTEEPPDDTRPFLETTNGDIPYIGRSFTTHDATYEFYSESGVAFQSFVIAQKQWTGLKLA